MKTRCVWCNGLIIPDYDRETGIYVLNRCIMCGRSSDIIYESMVVSIQAVVPDDNKAYGAANSKYRGKQRRRARGHTFHDED